MSRANVVKKFALIAWVVVAHVQAQNPAPAPNSMPSLRIPEQQQVVERSTATDAARYLAGMPVSAESPLTGLTQDPRWIAHTHAIKAACSQLDQTLAAHILTLH